MRMDPYLNFNGNAEEAFTFYKSVFGGEFDSVMRFKDMPSNEQPMPESEGERIMHISLKIEDNVSLMASDISEASGQKLVEGNNVYISLNPDTVEEAKRLYLALSEGGNVEMEFQKMFWGDYFGSFKDKFGIQWMINVEDKQ